MVPLSLCLMQIYLDNKPKMWTKPEAYTIWFTYKKFL